MLYLASAALIPLLEILLGEGLDALFEHEGPKLERERQRGAALLEPLRLLSQLSSLCDQVGLLHVEVRALLLSCSSFDRGITFDRRRWWRDLVVLYSLWVEGALLRREAATLGQIDRGPQLGFAARRPYVG